MTSSFIYDIFSFDGPLDDFNRLYINSIPLLLDFEKGIAKVQDIKNKGCEVIVSFPFVSRGNAIKLFKEKFPVLADVFDGFLLENIGDYNMLTDLFSKHKKDRSKFILCGDYSLNIANIYTINHWAGKLDTLCIEPEMEAVNQIALSKTFPKTITPEILACDKIIAMRSEHCFAVKNENYHCGNCGKHGTSAPRLKDENGKAFGLFCNPLDCNCIMVANMQAPAFKAEDLPENIIIRR